MHLNMLRPERVREGRVRSGCRARSRWLLSPLWFYAAVNFGIKSEYDVPPDVFMLKEMHKDALKCVSGTVKYHQAFNEVEHASSPGGQKCAPGMVAD
jgi:hypothetical protein